MGHHHHQRSQQDQKQRLPLPGLRPRRAVPFWFRQRSLSGAGGGDLLPGLLPRRLPLPFSVSQSSTTQEPLQEPERGPRSLSGTSLPWTQGSVTRSYPHHCDPQHGAGTVPTGATDIEPIAPPDQKRRTGTCRRSFSGRMLSGFPLRICTDLTQQYPARLPPHTLSFGAGCDLVLAETHPSSLRAKPRRKESPLPGNLAAYRPLLGRGCCSLTTAASRHAKRCGSRVFA